MIQRYYFKIKFLNFTKNSLNLLSNVYIISKLTSEDYSNINHSISTIAVPSILVAYNWTPRNNIERYNGLKLFVNTLFNNLDTFKSIGLSYGNNKWQQINPLKRVPGWKRHKVVVDYILNQY